MDINKHQNHHKILRIRGKGSLTIEAALVLPLFTFFIVVFLYFIQLFMVQEYIQRVITKTGLSLAKTAYVYNDFRSILDNSDLELITTGLDILIPDLNLIDEELDLSLTDTIKAVGEGTIVKALVKKELDTDWINSSCIQDGFDGISFYYTKVLDEEDCIDIIVRYRIRIPIQIFGISDIKTHQRVKLRGWTGYRIPPQYSVVTEDSETSETTVYIAETGTVYHKRADCSHISLSIKKISGVPITERNKNGAIYYPCESCCKGELSNTASYYITDYGVKYHFKQDCSGLKRTVREVPFSEVSGRTACQRCGQ